MDQHQGPAAARGSSRQSLNEGRQKPPAAASPHKAKMEGGQQRHLFVYFLPYGWCTTLRQGSPMRHEVNAPSAL